MIDNNEIASDKNEKKWSRIQQEISSIVRKAKNTLIINLPIVPLLSLGPPAPGRSLEFMSGDFFEHFPCSFWRIQIGSTSETVGTSQWQVHKERQSVSAIQKKYDVLSPEGN